MRAVCYDWCGLCDNGVSNIILSLSGSGSIDMSKVCDKRFFTPICNTYCTEPYNEKCFIPVVNNCFKLTTLEDGTNTTPLFTDDTCKNWIEENVKAGGSKTIDDKIFDSCNELNINPTNYANDLSIRNICACHFEDKIYENYYQSLIKLVPAIQYAGLGSSKCLFPGCTLSPYKSIEILGENICPTVQCIQGVVFNNDGTIKGDVTIKQDTNCQKLSFGRPCSSDANCSSELRCNEKICTKLCTSDADCPLGSECNLTDNFCKLINPPPSPSPSPSTNQNTGLIIGIVVGVIILIVIIGIIVLASSQPQKKK
jgi:hypothetical protein